MLFRSVAGPPPERGAVNPETLEEVRGGDTFAAESAFAATHSALPARVFLSVGAEEGKTMVPPMRQFGELLANRRYQGLTLDTVVFQGESHTSVVPAMVSRTMRVLYAKKK